MHIIEAAEMITRLYRRTADKETKRKFYNFPNSLFIFFFCFVLTPKVKARTDFR